MRRGEFLGILRGRARKSKHNQIQTPKISLVAFFNLRHKSNNVSILLDKSGNDSPNP